MNITRKTISICTQIQSAGRITCTPALGLKTWRVSRGLPANRTAEGILTDGPDYTFLDGRPTPLLQKQKKRMLKQQQYADQIVTLCSEVDFAKERYQNMLKAKEDERQNIISNRLMPKGKELYRKK